jgi:hypothetical protein
MVAGSVNPKSLNPSGLPTMFPKGLPGYVFGHSLPALVSMADRQSLLDRVGQVHLGLGVLA